MKSIFIINILFIFFFDSIALSDELTERETIRKAAQTALAKGDFDELENMAEHFRDSRERTESGLWKLTFFYQSFSGDPLAENDSSSSFERLEARAQAWLNTRPKSITAGIAYSIILSEHAWFLRGGGYYNDLTKEQIDGYWKYHERARDQLQKIRGYATEDPEWYARMVRLASEEGWPDPEFDQLIAEASKKEPYYYQTYFYAITRNTPNWGGDASKLNNFIQKAAIYTQEADGKSFIARGYWAASGHGKDVADLFDVKWSDLDRGFQDLVKAYPDQLNFNAYARFACLAKDKEKFLSAYGNLKEIIPDAWDDPSQSIICAKWAIHPE